MKVLVIGGGIGGFATALLPRLGTGDRPALRVEHHLAQQRGDRDDPDPVAGRRNEWQAADKIVYSTTLPRWSSAAAIRSSRTGSGWTSG